MTLPRYAAQELKGLAMAWIVYEMVAAAVSLVLPLPTLLPIVPPLDLDAQATHDLIDVLSSQ